MKIVIYAFLFLAFVLSCCNKKKKKSNLAPEPSSRKIFALLVGVESFDIARYKQLGLAYNYNNGATAAAKKDISNFKAIIKKAGVPQGNISELITKKATVENIRDQLQKIGNILSKDDTFIFYFTGHGDSLRNTDVLEDELNDQFLVTYNNRLMDDDIDRYLRTFFKQGTNIIMVIDACHSGSTFQLESSCTVSPEIKSNHPVNIIYLGATADNDEAVGTGSGSLFTHYLHRTYFDLLDDGDLDKVDYEQYLNKVQRQITCEQNIQFKVLGNINPTHLSKPFKID